MSDLETPTLHAEDVLVSAKYRLLHRVGAGGMGTVYAAEQVSLGRRVAVKILRPEYRTRPSVRERFEREARALAKLNSEYIVAAIDHGRTSEGTPFLVMEHLDGTNLRELLEQQGPLDIERAVRLVLDACRGMAAAHEQRLVHRDLKPENLFIARRSGGKEICKVLDFGIAKLQGVTSVTGEGALLGTLRYMAPEQIRGSRDLDARVDVFSLGAILYECLAGSPAFPGEANETLLFNILHTPPEPLHRKNPAVPQKLARIVERALASDRQDRYATVDDFSHALQAFSHARARGFRAQEQLLLEHPTERPAASDATFLDADDETPPPTSTKSGRDHPERAVRPRLLVIALLVLALWPNDKQGTSLADTVTTSSPPGAPIASIASLSRAPAPTASTSADPAPSRVGPIATAEPSPSASIAPTIGAMSSKRPAAGAGVATHERSAASPSGTATSTPLVYGFRMAPNPYD